MTTDRKKPGVAFWATVVLVVVLVGYPLSFGPVCWWWYEDPDGNIISHTVPWIYWPIGSAYSCGPKPIKKAIAWYATAGTANVLWLPTDPSGTARRIWIETP